jgi:anaerobic magnesium-protoporphyrin IX monomethyl ester cyclase
MPPHDPAEDPTQAGREALASGDWAGAEAAFARACAAAQLEGDAEGAATARANQASAARLAGRLEEAIAGYTEAWRIRAEVGLPPGAPLRLNLAAAQVDLGSQRYATRALEEARQAWEAALEDHVALAPPIAAAALLLNLAGLNYQLGDPALALERSARAEPLLGPEAPPQLAAQLWANRGLALLALDRQEPAQRDLERAAQAFAALGQPEREARQWAAKSDLHRYAGELDRAIELHERVTAMERQHGFRITEPGGLLYAPVHDRSQPVPPPSTQARLPGPTEPLWPGRPSERPFLLVMPPAHGAHGPVFPRGATSVASFLRAQGVGAEVLPLGHSVDDFAGRSQALAATRAALADAVEALRPRAVGLSVPFSYLYPRALEIAAMLSELAPEVPVVIGGPHVTFQDRECLADSPHIDVVVRGEGEWTALELLDALARGRDLGSVPGITWRAPDGTVVRNPRRALGALDTLPPVDFGLLPRAFAQRMEVAAITSRGCAYRCRFCHERAFWAGKVRAHAPERIVAEGDRLARDHDNAFRGVDDSMLDMREPYFHRLVELLGQRDWLRPSFGFLTRLDTVTPEGLAAMTRAGIRTMSVGAESGSQAVLEAMGKDLRLETVQHALSMARAARVNVNGFFIAGHPGDSPERAAESYRFIDGLFAEALIQWIDISIFTPYPGTPFFEAPARYGVEILSRDWSLWRRSNRPIAQLEGYGAAEIYLDYLRLLRLQRRWHAQGRPTPG